MNNHYFLIKFLIGVMMIVISTTSMAKLAFSNPTFYVDDSNSYKDSNGELHLMPNGSHIWGVSGVVGATGSETIIFKSTLAGHGLLTIQGGKVDPLNNKVFIKDDELSLLIHILKEYIGPITLTFEIQNTSGEVAKFDHKVEWNDSRFVTRQMIKPHILNLIYDPDAGISTDGHDGYRPYSEGMKIVSPETIPPRFFFGVEKSYFKDIDPAYGLEYGGAGWIGEYFEIGNIRYRACEYRPIIGENGLRSYSQHSCFLTRNNTKYSSWSGIVLKVYQDVAPRDEEAPKISLLRGNIEFDGGSYPTVDSIPDDFNFKVSEPVSYTSAQLVNNANGSIVREASIVTRSGTEFGLNLNIKDKQLAAGKYAIRVTAKDKVGNIATIAKSLDYTPDLMAPDVYVFFDEKPFYGGEVYSYLDIANKFSASFSEEVPTVSVKLLGGPDGINKAVSLQANQSGSFAMDMAGFEIKPGNYKFEIVAVDKVGNKNTFTSKEFVFSPPPPSLSSLPEGTLASELGINRILVPKTTTPIKVFNGLWPLTSNIFLAYNVPLFGKYDLKIRIHDFSGTIGKVTIGGETLNENNEVVINYDFGKNGGRLALPIGVSEHSNFIGRIDIESADSGKVILSEEIEIFDLATKAKVAKVDAATIRLEPIEIKYDLTGANEICGTEFFSFHDGEQPDISTQNGLICAIKFTELPNGIAKTGKSTRFSLSGTLQTVGENKIGYQYGFISDGVFQTVPMINTISIDGFNPKPIEINLYNRDGELATSIKKDIVVMMTAGVKSPHATAYVVEIVGDVLKPLNFRDGRANFELTSPVAVKPGSLWGYSIVKARAWYADAPDLAVEKEFTLRVVPNNPIISLNKGNYNSVEDVIITGQIGKFVSGGSGDTLSYSASEFGNRIIEIDLSDHSGKIIATSQKISVVDNAFSVNLGLVPTGTYFLTARSSLLDADGKDAGQIIKSQRLLATVSNGEKLSSKISTRSSSAPAPFVTTLTLMPDDQKRFRDIGKINWYVSINDGASWEVVKDLQDREASGAGLVVNITTPSSRLYKAVVANRSSGLEYTTDSIRLVATNAMKLVISGDNATVVGMPITLMASNTANAEANYKWEISKPGSKPFITQAGSSITLLPNVAENLIVKLTGVDITAPINDASAMLSTFETIRVAPAKMFPATIAGPRIVEAGKRYVFKAQVTSVFSAGSKTPLTTNGEWILPDGTRRNGSEIEYTPSAGDKSISYETWYVEMPNIRVTSTYYIQTWQYTFPEFTLAARVMNNMAPLMISLAVAPKTQFKTMGDDKLTYEWAIPKGVEVASIRDSVAVLSFPKSGVFQPAVTIRDTRGNSQTLMTEPVKIDVGGKVTFEVTPVVSDRWQRAPSAVAIQIKNLKVPYGDRYAKSTVYLNGERQVETTGISAILNVPKSGDNKLRVVAEGQLGSIGEVEQVLTLKEGSMPSCTLVEAGNKVSSLSVTARCSVSEGYVTGYKWFADGVEMPVKGSTISFTAQQIQAGIHEVVVEASTDKGKSDRFTLTR